MMIPASSSMRKNSNEEEKLFITPSCKKVYESNEWFLTRHDWRWWVIFHRPYLAFPTRHQLRRHLAARFHFPSFCTFSWKIGKKKYAHCYKTRTFCPKTFWFQNCDLKMTSYLSCLIFGQKMEFCVQCVSREKCISFKILYDKVAPFDWNLSWRVCKSCQKTRFYPNLKKIMISFFLIISTVNSRYFW